MVPGSVKTTLQNPPKTEAGVGWRASRSGRPEDFPYRSCAYREFMDLAASALAAVKAGTLQPVTSLGQMFCRIHVDDVAAACLHLMHRSAQGQHPEIVNVCDDEPAASVSVHRYAASLLNCELPQPKPFTEAEASMSAMARSFWADNRRVSNQRLRQDLGYELIYPTYRSGLAQCLEIETLTESRTPSSPA